MTGIEPHLNLANPHTHQHHIKQTTEAMNSHSRNTSSSQWTMEQSSMRDVHLQEAVQERAHEITPDPPADHFLGRRANSESMIKIKSFQSHQPTGDSREVSRETTLRDLSLNTSSSCDSPIPSSQVESTNLASWRQESQASPSVTTTETTTTNRKIYNRWLNKEVPYTTMLFKDSIKSPFTTNLISSSRCISNQIQTTHMDKTNSNTPTTTRLNRSWDPPTLHPRSTSLNRNNTEPLVATTSTSNSRDTSQNLDVSHLRMKYISNLSDSQATNMTREDSRPRRITSPMLHQKLQSEALRQNESRHQDSSQPKRPYNSDSNLAISYTEERRQMEERRQNLLKMHQKALPFSRDSSHERTSKSPSRSLQVQQAPTARQPMLHRQKGQSSQRHPCPHPKLVGSLPRRAELNKRIAETLWGKQLGPDENQMLCRNSLPRQSLASEARSKPHKSIDDELGEIEIEIQDILAQPLIAESTVSSPSLFDETTSSQSSSSPQTTIQTIHWVSVCLLFSTYLVYWDEINLQAS